MDLKQQFLTAKRTLENIVEGGERDIVIISGHLDTLNKDWKSLWTNVHANRTPLTNKDTIITEEDEDDVEDDVNTACLWLNLLEDDYRSLKLKTLSHLKCISDESNLATESALKCLQHIEPTNDADDMPETLKSPRNTTNRQMSNIFRCVYDLEHSTYCTNKDCPKLRCSKFKNIGLDTQHNVFRQYILLCFFHAKHCRRPVHSACVLCHQYKGRCGGHPRTNGNRDEEPQKVNRNRGVSKYCTQSVCLVPYCKEFREKISLHETSGLENMLPIEVLEDEFR